MTTSLLPSLDDPDDVDVTSFVPLRPSYPAVNCKIVGGRTMVDLADLAAALRQHGLTEVADALNRDLAGRGLSL